MLASTSGRYSSLKVTYEAQYGIRDEHSKENSESVDMLSREHDNIQCDDSVRDSVTEPVTSLSLQNPFAAVSPDIDIGSNSLPHVYRYPNPRVSVCNSGMTNPLSGDQSVCGVYNAAGGQSDQTIYGIEDTLRHRFNIEVENFRSSFQQIISDQFQDIHRHLPSYDHPIVTQPNTSHPGQYGTSSATTKHESVYQSTNHVISTDTVVPTEEVLLQAQEPHIQGLYDEMNDVTRSNISSPNDSGVSCIDQTDVIGPDTTISADQQMDQYVIRLLTAASIINSNLRNSIT